MNDRLSKALTAVMLCVVSAGCAPASPTPGAAPRATASVVPSYNPYRQRCAMVSVPAELPSVTELIDTVRFMGSVRALPAEPLSRGRLAAALYFSERGTLLDAHVIDASLPDSLARHIVELALSALREQAPRPDSWSLRLGFAPGAAAPLAVERSELCKPKPVPVRGAVGAMPRSARGDPNIVDVSQNWYRLVVEVSEEGQVISAKLLDLPPAAENALVSQWMEQGVKRRRYYPALLNGKPVAMTDTTREQLVVVASIRRMP
jgi:hypothetical protein